MKLEIGKSYMGIVTGIQPYGLFVRIENKIGLLHKSMMEIRKGPYDTIYNYEISDLIIVEVEKISSDGRISLKFGYGDELCKYKDDATITIPRGAKRITKGCFKFCEASHFVIPDTVNIISRESFLCCYYLKSITIPDNVSFIGSNAFRECRELSNVTCNANNIQWGDYVFLKCYNLKNDPSKTKESETEKPQISQPQEDSEALKKIKALIKDNPTEHIYVKWKSSNGNVNTARIFRPLKIHEDETISLEANGYIYYVLPENILSFTKEADLPINSEDWFGIFGNDR